MALVSTTCPECHASIQLDNSKPFGFCLSCGSKIAIATLSDPQSSRTGNTDVTKNYLELAESAKKSGNNAQCEMYCNKIIEIDNRNVRAWVLKGSAAGWQSNLVNLRLEEMLTCYGNAVKYAPDEKTKQGVRDLAASDLTDALIALYKLQAERFVKWPDQEEAQNIANFFAYELSLGTKFLSEIGVKEFDAITVGQLLSKAVHTTASGAETIIRNEFINSNNGYPDDYDLKRMLEKSYACLMVYKTAILMANKDYDQKIASCQAIINLNNFRMNAWSFKDEYYDNGISSGFTKVKNLRLGDGGIAMANNENATYRSEMEKAKREKAAEQDRVRKERNEKYWAAHAEDRKKLLSERETLEKEVKSLTAQLTDIDKMDDIVNLKEKIEKLQLERNALGIFKFKEKKAIDGKIADCQSKRDKLINTRKDPIQQQIDTKKRRIDGINSELTRDR